MAASSTSACASRSPSSTTAATDRALPLAWAGRPHTPWGSATEAAHEAARAALQVGHERADLGEPGPQLGVADFDRQQGVLELGERDVGFADRLAGALEERARALGGQAGAGRREGAA